MTRIRKVLAGYGLTACEIAVIKAAVEHGVPIIIDGDRRFPTGKSTLCQRLREYGAVANEAYEIDEGEATRPDRANYIVLSMQLSKPISRP